MSPSSHLQTGCESLARIERADGTLFSKAIQAYPNCFDYIGTRQGAIIMW